MNCIYCSTKLVHSWRFEHWHICPVCEPDMYRAELHTIKEQIQVVVGDLLLDRGRPYREGIQR